MYVEQNVLVLVCTFLLLMFISAIMSPSFHSLVLCVCVCVSQMHGLAVWLTASTAARWWKGKFGASVHLPAYSSPQMAGHAWVRLLAVSQTNSATLLWIQKHSHTKKHNIERLCLCLCLLLPLALGFFLTQICSFLIKRRGLLLPFLVLAVNQ